MFPMGIGIITTGMVGNSIGSNNVSAGKKKSVAASIYCFVIQMSLLSLAFIYSTEIAGFYTPDPEVLAIIEGAWPFFLLLILGDSFGGAVQGMMRGLGKQMMGFYATIFSCYIIGLPLMYYLGFVRDM